MRRDRLVAVGGPGGPGSGYVIGPRLVLTSAHVVGRRGALVQVFRPGADAVSGGVVVWCGTPGGRDDAALVEVDDARWRPPAGAGVRWGRLVTEQPGQPCATWGVPDVAQQPGAAVEAAQLAGTVNPGSGFVANRHLMDLGSFPPVWPADGSSPWGGLSGAAVFCGRLLTGVVAADAGRSGHAALSVVPAYVLHHDAEFRAVLAEHCAGARMLDAVEFQDVAEADPVAPAGGLGSAAALLQAGRQVVAFHGREELLDRLARWCRQEGFGSWLLHGPAGQGKTRLAHELAGTMAPDGWAVLWPRATAAPAELRAVGRAAKPLLVVLDYAETRAEQLAALLEAAAEHGGATPFKVLLLARTAGDWWTSTQAVSRTAEELLDGTPVVALPALESDTAARPQAYRRAAQAFAAALPDVRGRQGPDWPVLAAALPFPDVDRAGMDNALTLHMTALADLLDAADTGSAEDTAGPATGVEDRLLLHERRYWEQSATASGLSPALSTATLDAALAAALLVGAADRDQAAEVLRKVGGLADQPRDRRDAVLAWIAALYPPADAGPWGSLQPDRLTERLIGRRLAAHPGLAHDLVPGITEEQAGRLLTLYSRAAAHAVFAGRLDDRLTALCVRHRTVLASPAMAAATQVERPGPLVAGLQQIAADPQTPLDALRQLDDRLPRSERLAVWACDLARHLVARHRGLPHTPGLVWSLHSLSSRLAALDRREEALTPAEEAVTVARSLADAIPLIASLNTYADRLRDLGRREEAMAPITEAVALSRGLGDGRTPELVESLNRLAALLGDLGRHEAALAASEEAVRLRRDAGAGSDAEARQLARSLNIHSGRLWDLGRKEEAMEVLIEAARLHDGMTSAGSAYSPAYVATLNEMAVKGAEMGWLKGALSVAERVVHVSRAMARNRPDAYLPQLAQSLGRLAWALEDSGRQEEALAVAEEALAIQRGLVAIHPDAHLTALNASLSTVSPLYAALGRPDQALAATEECVRIIRDLARAYPDAHLPHLAVQLHTLGTQLAAVGRTEQALAAVEEALGIRRTLASRDPDAHLPGLASSLIGVAVRREQSGRPGEAVAALEEAVAVYRTLAATRPAHVPDLARALYGLSRRLEGLRRWDEALAAVREAFRLLPELALYERR
ncbi:tetratricopeptide repeat protein [Streptomyces lateritius]|uniref:tetratricopeptide repeat protein n=1 Tax=Streptomyces lateritius TaxID=67313 RepID=UPI001C8C6A00|nr:tetratricopeptide repeat protein [Streptomyces lateritius]MBX9427414.1 tetratricopeptide repeat protein [Streptomyces lateritius]